MKKDKTQEKQIFSEGIENIVNEIRNPKVKVVSFDIFDTLLIRPVMVPTDLFCLLENKLEIPNFHNLRITAEAEARKHKSVYRQDITIDDIYDTYAELFHLTDTEKERIKEEELKIEFLTLYERKSAKYLYEQAKTSGKEIVIISDMYLHSSFLDMVLKKNGYNGYKHIYVSSETGMLKSTKSMYQIVLSDLAMQGVKPREVLHIGDNKKSDVDCAIASGINAIHLPRAVDKRNSCKQLKRINDFIVPDSLNSNNAMLYGVLLNQYFDDPFAEFDDNSYFNGDAKLLGYWFAPILLGLVKWMIECMEKDKVEQLVWVWRDGYLPSILFQIIRPYFTDRVIEEKKIYMGREFRLPFVSLEQNGFFNSFADNPLNEKTTIDYFITNRLLCRDSPEQYNEILNIFIGHGYLNEQSEIGNFEKYRGFLYELEPYFKINAKDRIVRYSNYLEQIVERDKITAIFDRSLRGKSPRFLSRYFDINTICFTPEAFDIPKAKTEDIKSTVEFYLQYGRFYMNRLEGIWMMLFEIIMSDRAPGFKDIIDNLDGTYSVQLNESDKMGKIQVSDKIVESIQNSIIEFTEIFVKSVGEYMPYMVIERHGIFDYVIEPLINPYVKDAGLIAQINPGTSKLEPIPETVFINWYNRKIQKKAKTTMSKSVWDYIRHAGYVSAEKLGILLPARTLYRNIIGDPLEPVISVEKIQKKTDLQIDYISRINFEKTNVLFLGNVPQEVSIYFNRLSKLNNGLFFVFVAAGFVKVPTWLDFPCIAGPDIFSFWGLEGQEIKLRVPDEIKNLVCEKGYLVDLVKRRVLRGYSEEVATLLAYESERYYTALLDKINPLLLITWNNWGNNSVVPGEIAKRKGIPVVSAERGFLEGTIMLSTNGYGQDLINSDSKKFCSLPVSSDDILKAGKVVDFLRETGFNRYMQSANDTIEQLKQKINNGKTNVLLAGAFDCENPAFPANELYSPFFSTSREAKNYLKKLAKKNNWNLIYKPHPLMDRLDHSKYKNREESDVFYIRSADINKLIDIVDVVICMVSGVSYISLIRKKPLIALAHTPLKEKGCCYEPVDKSDIEMKIKEALEKGYTIEQENAFIKHIAQVNRYYYFDDLCNRPIRYGLPIEEAGTFIDTIVKKKGKWIDEEYSMEPGKYKSTQDDFLL